MHACGHDIHMAAFIGDGARPGEAKGQWKGTIIFDRPTGGRNRGRRPRLVEGRPLHAVGRNPTSPSVCMTTRKSQTGQIGVTEGYCYANVDSVDVTVRGVGGHGAYPHKTKDPIVLSAEIINALANDREPREQSDRPVVVTVGSIHGGTKHNIISDEVKMQLTVRTYKTGSARPRPGRHRTDHERVRDGRRHAAGRRLIVKVLKDEFTPATYNNPELTKRVSAALEDSARRG